MEFRTLTYDSPQHHQALALREAILRTPLGLKLQRAEWEEEDKRSLIIGGFEGETLYATCLLIPRKDGMQMRQVAVSEAMQGRGIGRKMLAFSEHLAREHGATELYAHARHTAYDFYRKQGYAFEGEEFIEHTIPHWLVRKTL